MEGWYKVNNQEREWGYTNQEGDFVLKVDNFTFDPTEKQDSKKPQINTYTDLRKRDMDYIVEYMVDVGEVKASIYNPQKQGAVLLEYDNCDLMYSCSPSEAQIGLERVDRVKVDRPEDINDEALKIFKKYSPVPENTLQIGFGILLSHSKEVHPDQLQEELLEETSVDSSNHAISD